MGNALRAKRERVWCTRCVCRAWSGTHLGASALFLEQAQVDLRDKHLCCNTSCSAAGVPATVPAAVNGSGSGQRAYCTTSICIRRCERKHTKHVVTSAIEYASSAGESVAALSSSVLHIESWTIRRSLA